MTHLTRSVKCPKCGNDIWDILDDTAKCWNCGYKRPFYRRNSRDDSVTPSQKKSAKKIRQYFDGSLFSQDSEPTREITKLKTTLQQNTGIYYVSIKTKPGNVLTLDGGYFAIGRRGAIRVLSRYRVSKTEKEDMKHIAKMIGGKVG